MPTNDSSGDKLRSGDWLKRQVEHRASGRIIGVTRVECLGCGQGWPCDAFQERVRGDDWWRIAERRGQRIEELEAELTGRFNDDACCVGTIVLDEGCRAGEKPCEKCSGTGARYVAGEPVVSEACGECSGEGVVSA